MSFRTVWGGGGEFVIIQMVHNATFDEAKEQWDRRKERIYYDNIFVKMGFSSSVDYIKKKYYETVFRD